MTETIPAALDAIPDGGDPILAAAKWFGLLVAALLVGAAPVMLYLRKYHVDHVANSRDAANAEVYETLRQQIHDHGEQLHRMAEERSRQEADSVVMRSRLAELEANEVMQQRLKRQLEDTEQVNTKLNERLDQKDIFIERLIDENRQCVTEIMSLKDRVHELELRLAKDEAAWCRTCDRYGKNECPRQLNGVQAVPQPPTT